MGKIQILNGNEIIVRGALEAGFSLYTGYPGSPLADFFNILFKDRDQLDEKGIKVVLANSEANAAAMASGAKQAGRDCLVAMKSMGLHVAADALSVGNFANPGPETIIDGVSCKPGVVIVVGDDPWSISTSTAADSRFLYKHLHIPFLEPSTPQELKDWIKFALEISKKSSVYCGVLLTTFMAEGGGRVELGEEVSVPKNLENIDTSTFDLSQNVMVPPNSLGADKRMITQRFPLVKSILKELDLDQQFGKQSDNFDQKLGFLTSGAVFEVLKQVLEEHGLLEHFPVYKVACPYPLVDENIKTFLEKLDHLVVVEEKRGFLEESIDRICLDNKIEINVFGKNFKIDSASEEGFPAYGGLNYEIVSSKIKRIFELLKISPCEWSNVEAFELGEILPRRLPTFCPGCPHRETLSLLKDVRKTLYEEGIDLISHGDVGCYSLSFLPPFKEMHNLSAMGQGGALGAGMDMFTSNPSVVLMGDSTFFHSGLTDISNSVQCGHNITYILLDNDNTAMTGHQMTPRSGISVDGRTRPEQDILKLVRAIGVAQVQEINPSDRYFYRNHLIETIKNPGVKIIVSNKECGLTFHSKEKARERAVLSRGEVVASKKFYQINTSACEDCRECVDMTGCPGLGQTIDAYGTKVMIDPQICVADSYCTKIKACPSFEMIEVINYHPDKYKTQTSSKFNFDELPLPDVTKTFDDIASGNDWRCVVTGVGGTGVTTVSRILAEAAVNMGGREDLDFKFVDQKGLAQRNGNVTGHLAIMRKGKSYAVPTPLGTADLYVSPDLLDGSQHLQFLGKDGVAILDKTFQMPLTILLDNEEDHEAITAQKIIHALEAKLGTRQLVYDFKKISMNVFDKSVYASSLILGLAYQAGRLPFSLDDLRKSFEKVMKKSEISNNWIAFNLGRKVFIDGDKSVLNETNTQKDVIPVQRLFETSIVKSLLPWENKKKIMSAYRQNIEKLKSLFTQINDEYLHQYIHDLYLYDRGAYIVSFMKDCEAIKVNYSNQSELSQALRILCKTYFLKDEVFISHVMISPVENYKKEQLYGKIGENFKITHINRPSFDLFGKTIEFDINPKFWMLATMRHFRFLRAILPSWHSKERKLAKQIRSNILNSLCEIPSGQRRKALQRLDNIKGYRDIRYAKAVSRLES